MITAAHPALRITLALGLGLLVLALGACGDDDGQDLTRCGNARIESGEQCDDGNTIDDDACTAVCRNARCGDGAIQSGVETCDGTSIPAGLTCESLGYAGGAPGCTACQIDTALCGAAFTPTPILPTATATQTPTATPSPSPTPTLPAASCGNGLLQQGETCTSCPADCAPAACTPSGATVTFAVTADSGGTQATRVVVQLAYRSSVISIPGSGSDTSVRQRVRFVAPVPQPFLVDDLDYAVDIDSTRAAGLPGRFATVRFDTCSGAPAPTVDDLTCFLQACVDAAGPIPACACSVAAQ